MFVSVAQSRFPRRRRPRRGSVLITALLFAAIIAIALSSYLQLSLNSLRMANRSYYQFAALNLAELGLERALRCYNQIDSAASPAAAWADAGWPTPAADNSIRCKFFDHSNPFSLGPGAKGELKVYCSHFSPGTNGTPVAVAKATVLFEPNAEPLHKYMEVTLRRRSFFANGMVARNWMVWKGGNALADSWNSDPDNNPATAAIAYDTSAGPIRANATVGTPNPANGSLDFGGGTIRGRVLNAGGAIGKSSGAILSSTVAGTGWDASLISNDFSASFPPVAAPNPPVLSRNAVNSTTPIAFPSTLPRAGDVAFDGVYFYDFASTWVMKASGGATNKLTISGPVVFLATAHHGLNVIDLSGNASIAVAAGGSLRVFTDGNIEASGNGITNANVSPATMQIFGLNPAPGGQTIRFVGNGSSCSVIYAPNATFELKGNGSLAGAVIASTITLNGNAAFHYDEALGRASAGAPFGVTRWRELRTPQERDAYFHQLDF